MYAAHIGVIVVPWAAISESSEADLWATLSNLGIAGKQYDSYCAPLRIYFSTRNGADCTLHQCRTRIFALGFFFTDSGESLVEFSNFFAQWRDDAPTAFVDARPPSYFHRYQRSFWWCLGGCWRFEQGELVWREACSLPRPAVPHDITYRLGDLPLDSDSSLSLFVEVDADTALAWEEKSVDRLLPLLSDLIPLYEMCVSDG